MQKTRLLILGYSSFLKRRVIPAIKKIKQIKYSICSKSSKINLKEKVLFNDYDKALAKTNSTIVYITLINSLHFKYAKKALEKGFNVIVDKPITTSLNETKKLLTIAKKKKLLLDLLQLGKSLEESKNLTEVNFGDNTQEKIMELVQLEMEENQK